MIFIELSRLKHMVISRVCRHLHTCWRLYSFNKLFILMDYHKCRIFGAIMLEICQESRWLNWRMVMNYMLLYVIIFLTRLLFGRETGKCCFDMLFFSHIEKTTQQLYYSNLVHEHWCFKIEQTYHVPVQKTPPLKFPNKHLLRWVWRNISQHWMLRKDQLLASSQHLPLAGTRYGLPWCP